MTLYIQIENGQPINHPAFEENLLQVFGAVPEHWEVFVRVEKPIPALYEILESGVPSYQKVDNVWTDVWEIRDMTAEEVAVTQQDVKDSWASREYAENWSAWTFDEAICTFVPPISRPETGNYRWCGAENNWKEAPDYPQAGGPYKFDFYQWIWVAE
jgi:hypothetical protein